MLYGKRILLKYILAFIIYNLLPVLEYLHDSICVELLGFIGEKVGQVIFSGYSIGQLFTINDVSIAQTETNGSQTCKVRALRWRQQNFPKNLRQFVPSDQICLCHIIAVMEDNSFSVGQYETKFTISSGCSGSECTITFQSHQTLNITLFNQKYIHKRQFML